MARAPLLILAAAAVLAACGRDDRVPETDTSKGAGIIDSAPGAALATVAATLTDENVFAWLDTAFTAVHQTDSIGAAKATDQRVKAFASGAVNTTAANRRGVTTTSDRLGVRRILPDRDVIKDHAERMNELRSKSGREFDEAYVRRATEVRRGMIDEIDDALRGNTRAAGVRTYLEQLRGVLQGEIQQIEGLGRANG